MSENNLFLSELDNRGVLTITLNRPDLHNAFNDELIASLTSSIENSAQDDSVRVIVLTGEGRSFCAGADLNWMKKMKNYSDEENFQDSMKLARLFEVLNSVTKPIVGKINGAALGGGVGLVAVCDYVIAKEDAKFGLTEVLLGLAPAVISPYVIAKIGESHARALFLTGEKFGPEKAKEIGLVHQISLSRYFEKDTDEVISRFLMAAPKAQEATKKLIQNVIRLTNDEPAHSVIKYTCETIARLRSSNEGQEGMSALLEKRRPAWLGEKSE